MKTLHLNLKRKWFDMILSGEKKEEYRQIKEHWVKQLMYRIYFPPTFDTRSGFMNPYKDYLNGDLDFKGWKESTGGAPVFEKFDTVTFSNGYAKDRDQMVVELKSISISKGVEKWGAAPCEKYFVLHLGNILETKLKKSRLLE